MENPEASKDGEPSDHLIVKADEVDQTGTDIGTVSDDLLMAEMAKDIANEQSQKPDDEAAPALPSRHPKPPSRPDLSRESAVPPPPRQPPPPAPPQQGSDNPTDSLSLVQLKKIVQEMPRAEQPAYAFEYADSQPFPEELDEWFQYNEPDRLMLLATKVSFEQNWKSFLRLQPNQANSEVSWLDASLELRKSFFEQMIAEFQNPDLFSRIESLEAICYVLAGVWGLTAGKPVDDYSEEKSAQERAQTPKFKSLQIKWIEDNVLLFQQCSGISAMFDYMKRILDPKQNPEGFEQEFDSEINSSAYFTAQEREANLMLTCFYLIVEIGRRQESDEMQQAPIRKAFSALKPNFLVFLVEIIARLRWGDAANVPLTRIVLLFWKSILFLFGGTDSLNRAKEELEPKRTTENEGTSDGSKMPLLTASPLDYHVFRQEITSKYPAYNPPPLVVPLELENNSILPPLPNSRLNSTSGLFSGVGQPAVGGNSSILHQSVHIATPAPSPPPSPIGPGGKAGKKQNYQTNQNFPFMYPPLDGTSNNIGGRGSSELQDSLVGKEWQGSDVPASIIEAGKLFSSRIKMTRALRQLWEERERFMKFDRGWDAQDAGNPPQLDSEEEEGDKEEFDEESFTVPPKEDKPSSDARHPEKETDNEDVQGRLDAIEDFYGGAMPHLQSIVIVLLKVILTNVTAMVAQPGQNGTNIGNGSSSVNGVPPSHSRSDLDLSNDIAVDELDNIRLREVTGKAVSGSLLLLLKWFKRSHILKFEYMTQLLLDSNYLPLILKMFAHQDIDKAIAQQNDREDMSFFHFCHTHSDHAPPQPAPAPPPEVESPSSEDEAVPPPILRRPQASGTDAPQRVPSPDKNADPPQSDITEESATRPEVDELGYPVAPHPRDPITTYSFRNFFTSINYLHIMQKITRDKAHRCLLLVQYKSSTILRKGIKIPDPNLRLYTLKLFKSQVPYCGRKWRQSNMRVITAIYLYCHPELRDDWLAGSDVDADVEEALPLEQALRGLTHWWHLRQYKDITGVEEGKTIMDEERDFFVRELESMGWGLSGAEEMMGAGIGDEGDGIGPGMNGTEWVSGPLMEGGY